LNRGCYFQVANTVRLGMSIPVAFRIALDTWASWVEKMIDTNRTHVFFRTYEPSHWRYSLILKPHLARSLPKMLSFLFCVSAKNLVYVLVQDFVIPVLPVLIEEYYYKTIFAPACSHCRVLL